MFFKALIIGFALTMGMEIALGLCMAIGNVFKGDNKR